MDRILFAADVDDPVSRLPIYIFDTLFLPSTDQINYDEFIPTLMNSLPAQPYVLIMFSCGLNKISWIWGIKFLKTFLADRNNLHNLWKIITVHDSWFVKGITEVLTNFHLTKKNLQKVNRLVDSFATASLSELLTNERKNTVIHCSTLSELSSYVDVTKLKISLNVYKHDMMLEEDVSLSMRYTPLIHKYARVDHALDPLLHHHFYQIFQILDAYGDKVELLFHKPGNKANTDILFKCINRDQLIWINDWDIYCIGGVFKRMLTELPETLVGITSIPLPVQDDTKYTKRVYEGIVNSSSNANIINQIFELCYKIIQNPITRHTSVLLSKCLSHCLSHELISSQNKNNILVINRFIKNVIENWTLVRPDNIESIEEAINGKENVDSTFMDYDLVLESDEEKKGLTSDVFIDKENIPTRDLTDKINCDTRELDKKPSILFATPQVSNSATINEDNHKTHESTPQCSLKETSFKTDTSPTRRGISALNLSIANNTPHSSKTTLSHKASSSSMFSGLLGNSSVTFALTISNHLLKPVDKQRRIVTSRHARSQSMPQFESAPVKKPVIRGRKVGELAKLFEERAQGIELLESM